MIQRQLAAKATPRSIWATLRRDYEWVVYNDVDDEVSHLRAARIGGMTEAEALHKKLQQDGVISDSFRK